MRQDFLPHSHPLKLNLGEYERLIDIICGEIPNLPLVPLYAREGAKQITRLVQTYFPTRGRRRVAIAAVAIGIARGARNVNELKDLIYRVKILTGQEIPWGQVQNTFEDIQAFLMNLHVYRLNRKRLTFKFTPEEKRVLRFIKTRGHSSNFSYGYHLPRLFPYREKEGGNK